MASETIEVEVPKTMHEELEEIMPDYWPIEKWAENQLVPAIAQFIEQNRGQGQQGPQIGGMPSQTDGNIEELADRVMEELESSEEETG